MSGSSECKTFIVRTGTILGNLGPLLTLPAAGKLMAGKQKLSPFNLKARFPLLYVASSKSSVFYFCGIF